MTKHITDHAHRAGETRLREYTQQERHSGVHPAIETLRTRPQTRGETNRKAAEFVRIDRGQQT